MNVLKNQIPSELRILIMDDESFDICLSNVISWQIEHLRIKLFHCRTKILYNSFFQIHFFILLEFTWKLCVLIRFPFRLVRFYCFCRWRRKLITEILANHWETRNISLRYPNDRYLWVGIPCKSTWRPRIFPFSRN